MVDVKPRVQALLVADHVYEDKATGKKVVAGIFDRLAFRDQQEWDERIQAQLREQGVENADRVVPGGMDVGSPYAYIRLTDLRGEEDFVLRYVYLNEDQPIFQTKFGVKWDDPLQSVDVVLPLPKLPANRAGTYALELTWKDELIGIHRINVIELPLPGKE